MQEADTINTDIPTTPIIDNNGTSADTDTMIAGPDIIDSSNPLSNLTYKQRLYAQEYVNNDGNGTKAYMHAYKDSAYDTAKANSSKLLTRDNIRNAIEYLADKHNVNSEVRIVQLANIAKGLYSNQTESTTIDKDGNVQSITKTVSKPKAGDAIKAIDLINKMTGLYKQQDIDADIARREYDTLRKRHLQAV